MTKLVRLNESFETLIDSGQDIWAQSRIKYDLMLTANDSVNSSRGIPIHLPKLLPVRLTDQTTRNNLKNCADLFRLCANDTIILLDPDSIPEKVKVAGSKRVHELSGNRNTDNLIRLDDILDPKNNSDGVNTNYIPPEISNLLVNINYLFESGLTQDEQDSLLINRKTAIQRLMEIQLSGVEHVITYFKNNLKDKTLVQEIWD